VTDDESIPSSPSDGERALAAQFGEEGLRTIDATLRSHAQSRWLKTARVIADALTTGGCPADDDYFDLHARRLIALVESGLLEGQGNLLKPRWSEVRLPQKKVRRWRWVPPNRPLQTDGRVGRCAPSRARR
jgi:hypothetical protein